MSVFRFLSRFFSFSALLVFGVLYTGCSQSQSSIEEPIDSVSIDSRIDDIQSGRDGASGINGKDGSSYDMSAMKTLEKELKIVNFNFDEFSISSSNEDLLSENSSKLNSDNFKSSNVKLEGNCDEWGSDEYNYALGLKRAKAVKEYLISEGVAKSRISIISFGESNPTCQDKTKSCWQKNRRVETKLLP